MKIIKTLKGAYRKTGKIYSQVNEIVPSIKGTLLGNKIAAYWWTGCVNFGDLLTPILLKRYGFTPVNHPINQAKLLSTGSILSLISEDYSGHIVGSGLISDTTLRLRKATFWALRGKLTQERLGAPKHTVLGDPGLLSSALLKQRQRRRYALGIVPHYCDKNDARISMIKENYNSDVLVIDVMRKPSAVFKDIDKCDCILSSSLHGLIVADSFNIPNAWIHLSDKVIGNGFKFHDYFSAMGINRSPLHINGSESLSQLLKQSHKPSSVTEEVKEKLDTTFRSLKSHLFKTFFLLSSIQQEYFLGEIILV